MLSNSLIQFSVDGWGCVPSLLFDLRPNYGGGNEDNGDLLQKVVHTLLHSVPLTPQQVPVNPYLHLRLLDTPRQVWVSLLWGSLLLSPWSQCTQVLFVPCKSPFPQSCVSSIIKSHWPPKSNSLGVLSPFARTPGWTHNSVGPITFLTA